MTARQIKVGKACQIETFEGEVRYVLTDVDPEALALAFGIKEKENTMEPKKIEWKAGEPTGKLLAAPIGAVCVVEEWWAPDIVLGLDTRTTRGSVVRLRSGNLCFAGSTLYDDGGFFGAVQSVTVTLPAPEWAEDRRALIVYSDGSVGVTNLGGRNSEVLARQEERGAVTIIRLPESVQDALDKAVAR